MRASQFQRLLESVGKLTGGQLEALAKAVASVTTERTSLTVIEAALPVACRHCGSTSVVRNGTRNGLQRYLCNDCSKSCNAATGTPLSRLRHKELFEAYARCMREGRTVRDAAATVGICIDTAHRWRMRFLANVEAHQPKAVAGMLEVDETYFRESQKGSRKMTRPPRARGGRASGKGRKTGDWVPVLVGRVRGQKFTVDKVLTRVTGAEVTAALKDAVRPGETVLCTDGHSAYLHLQRTLGVPAKSFVASYHGPVMDKVYHVQTANNYHEQLKTWIQRGLRGVATKHLPRYLAWMRLLSWGKDGASPGDILTSALGRQVINL